MTTILLTASRALLDTEYSRQWYAEELWAMANELTLPTHGISGDASSDKMARKLLVTHRRFARWWMYQLDGTIHKWWRSELVMNPCTDRWIPETARRSFSPKRLPLVRNEAMVNACSTDTICHAFIAPWSKTSGTQHTLGLAARRGLQVIRHDCPKEYGT